MKYTLCFVLQESTYDEEREIFVDINASSIEEVLAEADCKVTHFKELGWEYVEFTGFTGFYGDYDEDGNIIS